MKALSLTQPWAWLVVHGGKDIENRKWTTKIRGEFLIHASKGMKATDYDDAWTMARCISQELAWRIPPRDQLDLGGIVGVAELYGVALPWADQPVLELGDPKLRSQWHMPHQYGFRLRNVRPLPFLPCKGALGFWGDFKLVDGKAVQL